MKKLMILLIAMTMTGMAYADENDGKGKNDKSGYENHKGKDKDKKDKKDNDAHGTKALLERIVALEAQISSLGGISSDVSGSSYLMISENNLLWANNDAPVQGAGLSLGKIIYDFYSDGTGYTMVLSCDGNRLADGDFNNEDPANIVSAASCQSEDVPFTYDQMGNDLSIQFDAFPFPIIYFVADNGGMFVSTNVFAGSNAACTGDNAPEDCSVSIGGTIVNKAMRIGRSE